MPLDATGHSRARNVLGGTLELCSLDPLTGFTRNGCCDTGPQDAGSHTVCAVVTEAFLRFSKSRGNDLSPLCRNTASPASSPATAGAFARPAGPKPWLPARPPPWCCARRMRGRWRGAGWRICKPTRRGHRNQGRIRGIKPP